MSFILDQLKRSGRQRELELALRSTTDGGNLKAPSSEVAQPAAVRRSRGVYVTLVVLLLCLAGAFYVLRASSLRLTAGKGFGQAGVPVASPHQATAQSSSSMNVPKAVISKTDGPDVSPPDVQRRAGSSAAQTPVPAPQLQTRRKPAGHVTEAVVPAEPEHVSSSNRGIESTNQASARDTGDLPEMSQLPASVRKGLPAIKLASHLYRKEAGLVNISGRIVSEGVNLDNGLYLEKITPDGVILQFRGYRFHVRAN